MRIAASIVVVVVALALLAGCGDSGEETTGPASTDGAELIQEKWERTSDCDRPPGASRWGCSIGSYRCQAVVVDRGWSVSCARPGESVAFIVRR